MRQLPRIILFVSLGVVSGGPLLSVQAKTDANELKSDLELDIDNDIAEPVTHNKTPRRSKAREPSLEPSSPSLATGIEERIDIAKSQVHRKLFNEAIQLLAPANDILPRSGLLILAEAYAGKKDSLSEIRTLELCIAKNPKDYVAQTAYGRALIRASRVDNGLVAFQEATKLNPRYRPAYDALLTELEKKGERYEARNVIEDMRRRFGDEPKFFTSLCRLYAADDYNEKSIEVCELAIEKNAAIPENHMYLGLALMNREQIDRATSVLKSASRRFPRSEPVQWALGELAMTKKDTVSAFNHFKRAATANGKSSRAWVGYGTAAFKLQKNDEALKAFIKACKIERQQTREFRSAIGELRFRKDIHWQTKFEIGINECHSEVTH